MDAGKQENRGCLTLAVVATVLLPVLYVLSSGPAHWLMDHGYLSDANFCTIYGPLLLAAKKSVSVQSVIVWYIDLWVNS